MRAAVVVAMLHGQLIAYPRLVGSQAKTLRLLTLYACIPWRAVQGGEEVHRGFYTALQVVAEDLYKSMDSLIEVSSWSQCCSVSW